MRKDFFLLWKLVTLFNILIKRYTVREYIEKNIIYKLITPVNIL